MKILVLVKQLPDGDVNPFDACAYEEALKVGTAEVTLLSMGRPAAKEMLLCLSRLGSARNILLSDTALAGSDTLCTAYALSQCVKKLAPDLVFCGRQSIDGDTAQVGAEISALCGYSLITNVMKLNIDAEKRRVSCETRFGEESADFPAVLTVERINTLRFPRLTSKTGSVEEWKCEDADIDKTRVGIANSPTKVLKTYESTVGRRHCTFLPKEEFWQKVREEAKKARTSFAAPESPVKLPEVWAVGADAAEKAKSIAEKVVLIESTDVYEIIKKAKEEKPAVILWKSDLWGRRYAPIAAAKLGTGLCADCVSLETDGQKLYMIRPAFGGSITAKIECRTLPQMATVRTAENTSENVILSAGLGALGCLPEIRTFAADNGYGIAASRAVVDKGKAGYAEQVGLTGRTVSPKVYVALGISGAVQHTCAIERAGTVFAVNSDKCARIFDFADYGFAGDVAELF